MSDSISADELRRLKRTRATARRAALREATTIIDQMRVELEKANPGRGRGSVSQVGQFAAGALQRAADAIWERREKVEVP